MGQHPFAAATDSLPKWKGHLYNWIDVRTGKTLAPAFVSSVDSGNLAAALFSVRELAAGTDRAELAGKLLKEMDFSALYDWEKELFYIGYDAAAGSLRPRITICWLQKRGCSL